MERYVAVDIGGTKTAVALYGGSGEELQAVRLATEPGDGAMRLAERVFAALGGPACDGVALACPGPLNEAEGRAVHIATMGWRDVPVADIFCKRFQAPVLLVNDAAAAACGEYLYGAGAGTRCMVYLTVSTGVGGGIIADGKLYRGAAGNGGEFGHMRLDSGKRLVCPCGGINCAELFASGTAISHAYFARTGMRCNAEQIARRAENGEPAAVQIYGQAARKLAQLIENIHRVLDPEAFVLGGGVTDSFGLLGGSLAATGLDIRRAALAGKQGLLGAAALLTGRMGEIPARRGYAAVPEAYCREKEKRDVGQSV